MARVKINIPEESSIYQTEVLIGIDQINYGGHVGNDKYFSIMHEVRLRWFKSLGYADELSVQKGVGIFVVDAACEFTGEIFHGEVVDVALYVADMHKYGFDLYYRFSKGKDMTVFKGKTGLLSVDIQRKKAVSFPDDFWQKLG